MLNESVAARLRGKPKRTLTCRRPIPGAHPQTEPNGHATELKVLAGSISATLCFLASMATLLIAAELHASPIGPLGLTSIALAIKGIAVMAWVRRLQLRAVMRRRGFEG